MSRKNTVSAENSITMPVVNISRKSVIGSTPSSPGTVKPRR